MNYGLISLKSVYSTIKTIGGSRQTYPSIPKRGTPEYREYANSFQNLVQNIPGDKAVYLWLSIHGNDNFEPIYVGESHKNQHGLRGRLTDEFKQWYHVFWMTAFNSDKYEQDVISMYNTPSKDYSKEVKNQSLKKGATHIIYCSHNSDHFDPLIVQNDLIQLFGNPRGNAKDKRKNPLHHTDLHEKSSIIYEEFKKRAAKTESFHI